MAVAVALASSLAGQAPGFKVYISADMEGIAGVVDETQTSPTGRDTKQLI
jgi:hypothetical protein